MGKSAGPQRLTLKRGDVVIGVWSRDYSKARPGLVVQSDLFNEHHPSVTVCPVTSELIDATLFRLVVDPAETNGLKKRSQIMIDKIQTVPREKLSKKAGRLSASEMETINQALARWIGLEGAFVTGREISGSPSRSLRRRR